MGPAHRFPAAQTMMEMVAVFWLPQRLSLLCQEEQAMVEAA